MMMMMISSPYVGYREEKNHRPNIKKKLSVICEEQLREEKMHLRVIWEVER